MGGIFSYVILGWVAYLYVCGDDRVIYYPGADDVSGEPEAA